MGEIYELEIAFSDLDKNNDNYICKEDLKLWWQELGQTHSDLQIDEMISKFKPTVDGRIDFGEFIDVMSHKMKNPFLLNDLMESFMFCDYDKLLNLREAFEEAGNNFGEEEEKIITKYGLKTLSLSYFWQYCPNFL